MAIVVSGMYMRGITDTHMLPSLVSHVINALEQDVGGERERNRESANKGERESGVGREGGDGGWVHIFVHTEGKGNCTDKMMRETIQSALGGRLKGLVIRPGV